MNILLIPFAISGIFTLWAILNLEKFVLDDNNEKSHSGIAIIAFGLILFVMCGVSFFLKTFS